MGCKKKKGCNHKSKKSIYTKYPSAPKKKAQPAPNPNPQPSMWENIKQAAAGVPAQEKKFYNFEDDQLAAVRQFLQNALSGLGQMSQQPQQQFDFGPIEEQYKNQFNQETVPSIAERFTALGGGQQSSAFPQLLGQAGASLNTNLASLRSGFDFDKARMGMAQRGQQQDLLFNLLNAGLANRYTGAYIPRQPGMFENAAVGAAQGFGSALGGGIPGMVSSGVGALGNLAARGYNHMFG